MGKKVTVDHLASTHTCHKRETRVFNLSNV